MRFHSVCAVFPVALLVLTACGSDDDAGNSVAKPKAVANQADCVKYLSADEVRDAAGVTGASVHKGTVPGDCTFDLVEPGHPEGGQVQLGFGEDHVLPADATTASFEGNAAKEQRKSPGADAQQCTYSVLLKAGGGPNSSLLVVVLRFTKGKDVCSAAHDVARIVFDKLPAA
jgi:hypothetical protein